MSNISYIEQQLRNLGDYTGDGEILVTSRYTKGY